MKNKILVVDDQEGIRESLRLILEDFYELSFAANAQECLAVLKNDNKIKLLLLDIKMPKVTGLDVLKDVKSLNPNLKVIMITGYKSAETANEAVKLGADEYVVKPFEPKEILEVVKKFI